MIIIINLLLTNSKQKINKKDLIGMNIKIQIKKKKVLFDEFFKEYHTIRG